MCFYLLKSFFVILQRKKQQKIKKWLENDAKIKEKLQAQKIEMDREMLIRIQNLYIESQKFVTEGKESSQKVKNQELQQSKSDHDKVCFLVFY